MTTSISQSEKPIDESKTTAIIYSIQDIGEYIVEIRHHNHQQFIGSNEKPTRFGNLEDAKQAARKCHAKKYFLALHKIYQDVGITDGNQVGRNQNYDYMPLD